MKRSLLSICLVLGWLGIPIASAASSQCEAAFNRSDMWLFSFQHRSCTDRGWSISRRAGDGRVQCAALHPSTQMIVVVSGDGAQHAMFRNLEHDKWLTTADQFADVRLAIDGLPLFEGLTQVEVGASPPLRYGLLWPLPDDNVEFLRRGHALNVTIGDGSWDIGLGGSLVAIDQAHACANSR